MQCSVRTQLRAALASALLVVFHFNAQAALVASDNANQSAYSDGWTGGDNGGSGFQAWVLDGGNPDGGSFGRFIGSSLNLGGGSDINVSGNSFGMYANGGANRTVSSGATRSFNGGALATGQTFSFVLAVNFRNGNKGFDLRDSGGNSIWNFNVGGDAYKQNGTTVFGNNYNANTVFSFNFVQNAGSLSWTINRSGGLTDTETGTASISSGSISGIRFYVAGTDAGSSANDFYFNSLQVVPEPTNVALAVFGVLACGAAAWKKFRH